MHYSFLFLILSFFYTFTIEGIVYTNKIDNECQNFSLIFEIIRNNGFDYKYNAFNAQYCNLIDIDGQTSNTNPTNLTTKSSSANSNNKANLIGGSKSGNILRNLDNENEEDRYCYVSFLYKKEWYNFYGLIEYKDYKNDINKFIQDLKNNSVIEKDENIKIDCLSNKLNFMMKALLLICIYLI